MSKTPFPASIDRRRFLQSTGAAAGIGIAGVSPAVAAENTIGEVLYAEVGLVHSHPLVPEAMTKLPLVHVDKTLGHFVDEQNDQLFFLEPFSEDSFSAFESESVAFTPDGYHSLPAELFGEPRSSLVSATGRSFRPTQILRTPQPYRVPLIKIEADEHTLVIESDEASGNVPENGSRRFNLNSRQVPVRLEVPTGRRARNQNIPDRMKSLEMEVDEKQIPIRPQLVVRNYGVMDVIDATGRRVP